MIGHRIGYVRVSTFDQNPDRQLENVQVARTFMDKASGKDTKRPQFDALMNFIRTGDTLVVHSMDRLARNLDDLRSIVQNLTQRGVRIEFIKENLTFSGEDSPMAKQRGVYKGRKRSLSPEQILTLRQQVKNGAKKAQVARDFNISRETLYQYLRD